MTQQMHSVFTVKIRWKKNRRRRHGTDEEKVKDEG